MSDSTTRTMLRPYLETNPPSAQFLAGHFVSPPENFFSSEEVEIDLQRGKEDIAIPVPDLSTDYRMNSTDIYTNKSYKPSVIKEALPLNSWDLLKREAGKNPFANNEFLANLTIRALNGSQRIVNKIRRTLELQAAQVLQTGAIDILDAGGNSAYKINYFPKASHFPTVGVAWGAAGATPYQDIDALAQEIRCNGKKNPDVLIMGDAAFREFIKDPLVLATFDNRRFEIGMLDPRLMGGDGGSLQGMVKIGNYQYAIWTYGAVFEDPQTQVCTPYVDPAKVIVMSSAGRKDALFGAVPNIGQLLGMNAQSIVPGFPTRLSDSAGGMDIFANSWVTAGGHQLFTGFASRPLMVPTAIDTYGCLDTLTVV